ncbi:hypothetical protein ACFUJR_22165 [Streptomyces sp. NPDC057271]|uniref:hypothetical protein n=1 Tax=unclassified Streptomyces TaxID=2593676 RepID=UPI002E0FA162|nr:hypothetical protein OG393_11170 [Streptomyces sp. NBC_01216]
MPIKLKEWAAISRPEYRRMARDTRFDLAFRVHFAALGKANQLGHAELASGELAAILTRKDGQPQPKQGVSRAIKSAKDLGLVSPSSDARCLVLPGHLYDTARGSLSCKVHGIHRAA